mgnify:CR=1 FL=1
MPAIWNRGEMERGTPEYWREVARLGLPAEDWDAATCESDSGHGPCGKYKDWADGTCVGGHAIEFGDDSWE